MKEKFINFIKENKWIIITLALSTLIISVIYTLQKIAPFGSSSMLDVDFYHQYGPLLNELYDRVKSGETLLYSFNTGGGIPFYRNFLNYLSSPFNILLFLFKKENIVMAFSLIIGLKVVFASTTMAYYLKKTFNKNNIGLVLFGTLYAFSGYFCAYYWNIMWLDGMVFLPIIMYGINKIITDEKPYVYIISLAIMLFANYFIGYMICIFSVFYFIGVFIYKGNFKFKNIAKKFIMFAISSVLAAGLMAFLLLPLFHSLTSISATGDIFPTANSSFSISNYIFNHFTGVSRTVFASDILPLPNVYSGMLTLVLIVLLFINKKINLKFKIISSIALLFFFISFNINVIDFMWHAFHVPNDLPWRYSFIYVFVLITIGYYSFTKIKDVSIFKLSISFAIIFIFVLLASKVGFENISDQKVITCLALLIMYYIISILYKNKFANKKALYIVFLLVVSFECIYGINANWEIDHDIKTFMSDKKPYKNLISKVRKEDNDLYRIEKTSHLTLNDGAWYDYYGMSTFSSMAYESVSKNQRMLGLAGNNINSYYYKKYQTPVYNTIFNVKYIMGEHIDNDYYVPLYNEDGYNASAYNYSSSIGYAVDNKIKDWHLTSYEPFLNQSNFVNLSTSVNDIFIPVKVLSVSNATLSNVDNDDIKGSLNYHLNSEISNIELTLDTTFNDNIYLYVGGNNVESFEIDGSYYSLTSDEYYVFDAGKTYNSTLNIKINLNSTDDGVLYFYAYRLNKDAFDKFYNKINKESLNVKKYSDTYIEGDITVSSDKTLFTSIAYDDGWSIYIDGKKVKTKKIADSYLSALIPKGKHTVKLIFYPKGMKEGIMISFVSLVIFVLYYLFTNNKVNKKSRKR